MSSTKEYSKAWNRQNRKKINDWKKTHKESVNRTRAKYKIKLKVQVMTKYSGGKPKCVCCWETEIQFLTLYAVSPDEPIYKRLKKNGWSMYYELRKNDHPGKFQVLCWNCYYSRIYFKFCHRKIKA